MRDNKMVRHVDDLVVLCRWRIAETYMPQLRAMLARLSSFSKQGSYLLVRNTGPHYTHELICVSGKAAEVGALHKIQCQARQLAHQ